MVVLTFPAQIITSSTSMPSSSQRPTVNSSSLRAVEVDRGLAGGEASETLTPTMVRLDHVDRQEDVDPCCPRGCQGS